MENAKGYGSSENNKKRELRATAHERDVKPELPDMPYQPDDASKLTPSPYQFQNPEHASLYALFADIQPTDYVLSSHTQQGDYPTVSLKQFMQENTVDMPLFLQLAIQLSHILGTIHQHKLVYQHCNPYNIAIHLKTFTIKLLQAPYLEHLYTTEAHLEEKALAYISPEQTGRIKQGIDHRTDLYSAGVIFYELLIGTPPFVANSVLELLHCHIAKTPVAPSAIHPAIPAPVSAIVVKLLEKNADGRYQTAFSLKHDLEECLRQHITTGSIAAFSLAQKDFLGNFKIPQQLYGREKELTLLLKTYTEVKKGSSELVLIAGFPGVGKSALVQELHKSIATSGGFFVMGKYNQFQQNIPYHAFIQTIRELVSQLVTQEADRVETWRATIQEALGKNGKVLTELFPSLEMLIGKQPEAAVLEAKENENRFTYLFRRFIKAVATRQHPLVMVVDDLQWADVASLKLLQSLTLDKEISYLFIIGIYRNNEVADSHHLSSLLKELPKTAPLAKEIVLQDLSYRHVNDWLTHVLHSSSIHTVPLTDLIYDKTQGNALFLKEFLQSLYNENLLTFDFTIQRWTWKADQIKQLNVTDNVLDLLSGKIQKLPATTQQILKLAACLGNQFTIKLVSIIHKQSSQQTLRDLQPAIIENLVTQGDGTYTFAHDRIQQAAYSLIAPENKSSWHLEIGMLLLQHIPDEEQNLHIFDIANQFNACINAIRSDSRKEKIAEFYCLAGSHAKTSAAYKLAKDYFHNGMLLLPDNNWKSCYDLSLKLYVETAECSYLCGDFELMEECITLVLRHAIVILDKIRVYETRIRAYTAQSRLEEAMQTALEVLALLQIVFPKNPGKRHVLIALVKNQLHFVGRSAEHMLTLPLMRDALKEAAIRILSSVSSTTYFAYPNYFPLFICKAFGLLLRYGNMSHSSIVTAGYSAIISAGTGNLKMGYQLAQVALQLMEKFPTEQLRARTILVANAFHIPGKTPLKNTLPPLLEAIKQAQLIGDHEYAGYAALSYGYTQFMCGKPLKELFTELTYYNQLLEQLSQDVAFGQNAILTQTVFNLLDEVKAPTLITGDFLDEVKMKYIFASRKSELAIFELNLCKLILCYLFGSLEEGTASAREAEKYIKNSIGNTLTPMYYLYDSLIQLALAGQSQVMTRNVYLQRVAENRKKMLKFVNSSPSNYLHKLHLIDAEVYRVKGDTVKASYYYQQAISAAKENEFINEEALAYELAAKFYIHQQHADFAKYHLQKAHETYLAWGAVTKATNLAQQYPQILANVLVPPEPVAKNNQQSVEIATQEPRKENSPALVNTSLDVDVSSILKVVKAISNEVAFDKLKAKLMDIAIENAGAQKGFLILERDGELYIEAMGSTEEAGKAIQPVVVKGNPWIPEVILQYVFFTKENVVINEILTDNRFNQDPMVIAHELKSVFCMPILPQGDLLAMLYFENSLTSGVFMEEHVEFLKFLSDKIASFLEKETLLKQLQDQQQQTLQAVIHTQEDERKRIAEDLHDGLGYMLSTLKLNLTSLQELPQEHANQEFLENALRLLDESFKELRSVANDLMPDSLFVHGLKAAVAELCRRITQLGKLQIRFTCFNACPVNKEFDIELYRIIQEIINNVLKHAEATHLEIQFVYHTEYLIVTAEDDGKGFDYEQKIKSGKKGKGLSNIVNRAKYLHGQVQFDSTPGRGTSICIQLPLPGTK
jgi:predicted ATPase/signal transduction histidine kinase